MVVVEAANWVRRIWEQYSTNFHDFKTIVFWLDLNLLTLQMGNDVMVAVKAKMVDPGSAALLIENINQCEKAFKARFSSVAWLFFEPDDKD